MIVNQVLAQGIIVSVVSVYDKQSSSDDDSQKDNFYNHLITVVSESVENKIVVTEDTSMVMLEVIQKTMSTSMEFMNMELQIKKEKGFWTFVQL